MSNTLTGDFDVVVQASLPAINRVLATQHQAETFLHSFTVRINDAPPILSLPLFEVAPQSTQGSASESIETSTQTTGTEGISPAEQRFSGGTLQGRDFTGIRGFAEIQDSTPTITLPGDQNGSQVTIHYQIMVHFIAEPQSTPMPEFLHGELQATVDVAQVTSQVGNVFEIDFTRGDFTVNLTPFFADPPLSPLQNSQINQLIHNILSAEFQPVNAVLPGSIQLIEFKALPNVPQPAAALLLDLRADAPPNPDPGSVTRGLLNADDQFAVAAGRDFVIATLKQALTGVNADFDISFHIDFLFIHITINYHIHLDLDHINVDLQSGQIVLTINGRATSRTFPFPSFNFSVRQGVTLSVIHGPVFLVAVGDPDVSASGIAGVIVALFKGAIVSQLRSLRDQILQQADPIVQQMLDVNTTLGAVLNSLNISANLAYTSFVIEPDGVILHGTLDVPNFESLNIEFSSNIVTVNGVTQLEFNALNTWIPGGTIVQYGWTGPGEPPVVIIEPHRFITRVPQGNDPAQWCLSIAGTQITAQGTPVERGVSGLSPSCVIIIFSPGLLQAEDTLLKKLTVTLPGHLTTDQSPEFVADVAPWGGATFNSSLNMLVHFADSHVAANLSEIRDALFESSKRDSALLVVAVVPSEHRKVNPIELGANGTLVSTEDPQGSWRQVFGVKEIPATYLVTPDGQIAWQYTGRLQEAKLKAAFDQYLIPGGHLFSPQLGLTVQVDEPAPDFLFEYVPGREIALRRLRGRRVLLAFWTSWSKASLEELRNLQKLQVNAPQRDLFILAINDGENPEYASEDFKKNGFTFQVVTDPNRQISQLYGVNCWPTTVSINEDGLVSGIQFGLTPAREDVVLTSKSRNIGP